MPANRLINEKSPYLLQHAHNPVDWYPWGEEAFRKAHEDGKPIFLSVGYSTCHWCHVMERESFENGEIAELLNRYFVPVKVDREERPDVDRVYMLFVQASTGSGGWPMSVWLTPELKPFFGGTYFPPEARYQHPGFKEILLRVAEAWSTERQAIEQSGASVIEQLLQHSHLTPVAGGVDQALLDSGFYAFRRSFDTRHGGFGGAPKFPRPVVLNFLLRYYALTKNLESLEMVFVTLNRMARGGMRDHLRGGFHRYSVDERWFVPHFEKMLYDQAQLAVAYLDGYQISNDAFYAGVARATLDYVRRDMTDAEGGFYSAQDADSIIDPARPEVKGEGAFYVWTRKEIEQVLGPDAEMFSWQYGVEEGGNVREDPHHEFVLKNILYLAHLEDETAQQFGIPLEQARQRMSDARAKLLRARCARVRPHRDDKILTAWNGLMISAFARGAHVLGDERYLEAARRAAECALARMADVARGTLVRRFRDGEASIPGFLDDYAFFAQGLLDLYETGFDVRHLEAAIRFTEAMLKEFEDSASGGFFATAAGNDHLVMRLKDDYDGAEPSGNSVAIANLLRVAQITGGNAFRAVAMRALGAFSSRLASAPVALPRMLAAAAMALSKPGQIIISGRRDAPATRALLEEVQRHYVPDRALLLVDDQSRAALARHAPEVQAMQPVHGEPAAYVCENFACALPVTDPVQLGELLERGPAGAAGR